jgi:hypothetical protein
MGFYACGSNEEIKVTTVTISDTLETEDTVDIPLPISSVKSDDYYDNFENKFDILLGCWAAIREGNLTISFAKDSSFEFFDYNDKLNENEVLTGRFEIEDSTLILLYSDRPKQKFRFKKDPEANNEYRITNSAGYYFLKSNCPTHK